MEEKRILIEIGRGWKCQTHSIGVVTLLTHGMAQYFSYEFARLVAQFILYNTNTRHKYWQSSLCALPIF